MRFGGNGHLHAKEEHNSTDRKDTIRVPSYVTFSYRKQGFVFLGDKGSQGIDVDTQLYEYHGLFDLPSSNMWISLMFQNTYTQSSLTSYTYFYLRFP